MIKMILVCVAIGAGIFGIPHYLGTGEIAIWLFGVICLLIALLIQMIETRAFLRYWFPKPVQRYDIKVKP